MDYRVTDEALTQSADSIRSKSGSSASIPWDNLTGFKAAIDTIPTGGGSTLITKTIAANGTYDAQDDDADGYSSVMVSVAGLKYESGSFTCPDSGSSYTLNFANTYSKYMIAIVATAESVESIMASGATSAKTFALHGFYPKANANNTDSNYQTILDRIKPSASTMDAAVPAADFTYTGTSFTGQMGLITSGANYLYRGLTYNYFVVEVL